MIPNKLDRGDYILIVNAEREKKDAERDRYERITSGVYRKQFMVGNLGKVLEGKLEDWLSGKKIVELTAGFAEEGKVIRADFYPSDLILKVNPEYSFGLDKEKIINSKELKDVEDEIIKKFLLKYSEERAKTDYEHLIHINLDFREWVRYPKRVPFI